MKKLILLKIGGSVITYKNQTRYTLRRKHLREVFLAIKKSLPKNTHLIIVQGAGGHIHHLAHKHDLKNGTGTSSKKIIAACAIHQAVRRLNQEVADIAAAAHLNVWPVDTASVTQNTQGKISHLNSASLLTLLDNNLMPIIPGDIVPDTTGGFSICSGDQIIKKLATLEAVSALLFATDVDGIYTSDPHANKTATLLSDISLTEIKQGKATLTGSRNHDVTGGLKGKIDECKTIFAVNKKITTIAIFNGLQPQNYNKIFTNKTFPYTAIKK